MGTSRLTIGAAVEIGQVIDSRRDELVELCGRLVAARSENPPGHTEEAAVVLTGYLSRHGVETRTATNSPHKPNVIATIAGHGAGPHLILNVHLDTVQPGDPADWSIPIYEMTQRNGRLYGLGIGNMKAAVAAQSLAVAVLAENRAAWRGRITFAAVADEVVFGPDGAAFLLETEPDLLGDAVICGEGPGDMTLGVAEKGVCWIALEARAPSGQGMLTERGTSAIARLASALTELDRLNEVVASCPDEIAEAGRHAGDHRLRLSVNAGTIAGGHFVSQAATRAVAEIDFRIPPGLTVADIERRVGAVAAHYPGLSFRRIKAWDPNWTAPDSPIAQAVAAAHALVRGARRGSRPCGSRRATRAAGAHAACRRSATARSPGSSLALTTMFTSVTLWTAPKSTRSRRSLF